MTHEDRLMISHVGKPIDSLIGFHLHLNARIAQHVTTFCIGNVETLNSRVTLYPVDAQNATARARFVCTCAELRSLIADGTLTFIEPDRSVVMIIRRRIARRLNRASARSTRSRKR